MEKILKNKKILITAGPTWVPLDKVRVITNIFNGKLGLIIAQTAYEMGAKVTLILGPSRLTLSPTDIKNLNVIPFKYFDDLLKLVKMEVGSKKYNAVIQSAAVSDYTPVVLKEKKIKSGKKDLTIRFKPTVKIVDLIKKIDPSVLLVKFKLEVDLTEKELIKVACNSMLASRADFIVANDFKTVSPKKDKDKHKAFIIDSEKEIKKATGKKNIAKKLLEIVASKLNN